MGFRGRVPGHTSLRTQNRFVAIQINSLIQFQPIEITVLHRFNRNTWNRRTFGNIFESFRGKIVWRNEAHCTQTEPRNCQAWWWLIWIQFSFIYLIYLSNRLSLSLRLSPHLLYYLLEFIQVDYLAWPTIFILPLFHCHWSEVLR